MIDSSSVALPVMSFFSTTVDDFVVILIFFAREYVKTNSLSDRVTLLSFTKISVGQILGFSGIVVISLVLGLVLHSVIDNDYIDLIGLLPVLIGLYKIYEIIEGTGFFIYMYKLCCCIKYTKVDGEVTDIEEIEEKNEEEKTTTIILNPMTTISGLSEYSKLNITSPGAEEEKDGDFGLEMSTLPIDGKNSEDIESGENQIISTGITVPNELDDEMNSEKLSSLNEVSSGELETLDQSSTIVIYTRKIFQFLDPLTFEVKKTNAFLWFLLLNFFMSHHLL